MTHDEAARPGDQSDPATDPVTDAVAFGPGTASDADRADRAGRAGATTARRIVTGGLAVVLVGGVAWGASWAAGFLTGGGPQPEDVLPASTVAFAKIDLNPSAGQKVNALRLLQRFPKLDADSDDLKAALVRKAFDENDYGLTYDADIAPWLGDRAAVAAIAAPGTDDGVLPVAVLEFTDRDKMTAAMEKLDTAVTERSWSGYAAEPSGDGGVGEADPDGDEPFAYAVRDSYVFLGDNQAELDEAVAAEQVLADADTFRSDEEAVDGDGKVGLAWADLGAVYAAVPATDKKDLTEAFGDSAPTGRVTAATSVESDYVEVTGRSSGLELAGFNAATAADPGTELLQGLPADVHVAFSATGLGEALVNVYDEIGTEPLFGTLDDQASSRGLKLPEDLGIVFGTEFAAGARFADDGGEVVVRADSADPARAVEALKPLLDLTGEPDLVLDRLDTGYVAATSDDWATAAADGTGGLGGTVLFDRAVADADNANLVVFLDLQPLVNLFRDWLSPEELRNLEPLEALGISAAGDGGDVRFTGRLTFQ
ncbi:DUF3352 domain-containing protein [Nocardioides mesophilus]|uniref:DUF3352 domain-containing protein n=1 Tax=Nocardioides mesophilus TaxID=433659 RepID=A0A7G9RCC5_9ACTN|nr:DUF3352 domain-containing protein [Nocardioides mesophilus]QNN53250.1 DUF3352 domain-containing protein [Nocardioides mesophilus]